MSDMPIKEREVRVGDEIPIWAFGSLRRGKVTQVIGGYIWIAHNAPETGMYQNTKRHRDIALLHSKYY